MVGALAKFMHQNVAAFDSANLMLDFDLLSGNLSILLFVSFTERFAWLLLRLPLEWNQVSN